MKCYEMVKRRILKSHMQLPLIFRYSVQEGVLCTLARYLAILCIMADSI